MEVPSKEGELAIDRVASIIETYRRHFPAGGTRAQQKVILLELGRIARDTLKAMYPRRRWLRIWR